MSKKILFLSVHRPHRSPSQRFRFEQYISYLNDNGFSCTHSFLLNEREDKIYYSNDVVGKAFIVLKSTLKRLWEVLTNDNDIVFVQRESYMLGTAIFEKLFSLRSKVVFDYDDSIWMQNVSEANKRFSFLKDANKTKAIISKSSLVFAGNPYLAAYAKEYCDNVVIVPTTIDTDTYKIDKNYETQNPVCIGWSGSVTTIQHFKFALPFLEKLKKTYGDKITIRVIGDKNYVNEQLQIQGLPWVEATEIKDLSQIDIGIMPLPDDEWAKGKCGLKGLQYMALGIPTIMSPVGVNSDIIQDGENGYLATTEEEWIEKITLLINDASLRNKIGQAGKNTVVNHYSVHAQKDNYVKLLTKLIS